MKPRLAAQVQLPQLSGCFSPSFTPLVILQAVHIAELTGTLRARRGAQLATVAFTRGEISAAETLDSEGVEALVAFNQWTEGHFDFTAGPPASAGDMRGSFNYLMLEVCRRLDEARARGEAVAVAQPALP
jgi:hypothetical protein